MIVGRGHLSVVEHQTVSVKFICDRGVSHELVRHRIASFSQESTRYCNYSKDKFDNQLTFIIPSWSKIEPGEGDQSNFGLHSHGEILWLNAMQNSQEIYNSLIQSKWSPQEARSVLPNSLKTEIVVTANLREWREIFRQRCSPAAHPQMRELMVPLRDQFKEVLPEIFGDGKECSGKKAPIPEDWTTKRSFIYARRESGRSMKELTLNRLSAGDLSRHFSYTLKMKNSFTFH